jgi:hypothetical protein
MPSGPRADQGGHILPHVGKDGLTNPKLMRDNAVPPAAGENWSVIPDRR